MLPDHPRLELSIERRGLQRHMSHDTIPLQRRKLTENNDPRLNIYVWRLPYARSQRLPIHLCRILRGFEVALQPRYPDRCET